MAIVARPKQPTLPVRQALPAVSALLLRVTVALALAIAATLAIGAAYGARTLPGLTVAGMPIGSLDAAGVRSRLAAEMAGPWAASVVTLRDGDRTWSASGSDLGIAPDVDAAVDAALRFGRSGSPIDQARAWAAALRGRADVPLAMRVADQQRLDRWLEGVASGIDRAAVEGEIRLTAEGASLRAPVPGRQLDRQAMVRAIVAAHSLGDRQLELATRSLLPSVDAAGFDEAAAIVRAITTPLEITAGDRAVREDPAGLTTLIRLERTAARPGDATAIAPGAVAPASRFRYDASLDEARVGAWIAAVAAALDRPAKNATYVVAPGGTLTVVPGQDGTKVDQEALARAVLAELVRPAPGGARAIAAPVATETPVFTTADATRYVGAMVPISQFTTYYPPSATRFANISTGANQFDNLVIAPGESFSFWDRLGPVTVERGYKYAGAIINNRSDEHVIGGGLCQVSTTLFNAVARAGYQVDERHSHGYYIDRYPIGLDAAVFEPGVDFRWTNDTPYPVLITSSGGDTSVGFQLWSLPTGRAVTFGGARVSNLVGVKPDQPADPAFAPGYAVDGRDVVTTRTVTADGQILHADVWASHYVPVWGGPASKAP